MQSGEGTSESPDTPLSPEQESMSDQWMYTFDAYDDPSCVAHTLAEPRMHCGLCGGDVGTAILGILPSCWCTDLGGNDSLACLNGVYYLMFWLEQDFST